MYKFKKGDRVMVIAYKGSSLEGRIGTVVEDSDAPWVHFDDCNPSAYPSQISYNDINIPAGHADCIGAYNLELIPQQPMELSTTKDKVREAAKQSPTVEGVLKTLFPDAFEKGPLKLRLSPHTFIRDDVWVGDGGNGIVGSYLMTQAYIEVRTRTTSSGETIIEFFEKD